MADYFIVEIRVSYIVRKLFAVSEKIVILLSQTVSLTTPVG